jgi:simple sugar transport system ATP-binding protein
VLKYILQARDRGIGVIFITHNPHHAYPVGDHFVILRRGQVSGDFTKEELPLEQLVQMMAGGADLEVLQHELEQASQEGGAEAEALARTAGAIGSTLGELGEGETEEKE